jgi:hypothetical protein
VEKTAYRGSTRWHELNVNRIALQQPLTWLSKAVRDMRAAGLYSLRYGLAFTLALPFAHNSGKTTRDHPSSIKE